MVEYVDTLDAVRDELDAFLEREDVAEADVRTPCGIMDPAWAAPRLYHVAASAIGQLRHFRDACGHDAETREKGFGKLAKIIGENVPIARYSLSVHKRYSLIVDKEKILQDLDTWLLIDIRQKLAQARKLIKEQKLGGELADRVMQDAHAMCERSKAEAEYIKSNHDKLDLRRTNYAFANSYVIASTYNVDGKSDTVQLRTQVPNLMIYEPTAIPRKDAAIEDYLRGATLAFEKLYYAPLS